MNELKNRIKIVRSANPNFERRYFVPDAAVSEVLSESTVRSVLKDLRVPAYEVADLTDGILRGARKCFAILVLIDRGEAISNFFRGDSLQQSRPDDRLPYTSASLQRIFSENAKSPAVTDFFEKQWEFAVPIMRPSPIFRRLDTEAILPFLRQEPAGEGSMGTAWKIELHPQCHELPLENHTIIRKQVKYREKHALDFEKELENLALLTHLKHRNIVQLYCAYIYRQEYNLVFAVADGGSLADFLDGKHDTKALEGPQLLVALAELASAIDAMHNFTSETLELSLSGCHRDLAPRNILIHGDTFLLADFGLSTFRNTEEDSLTTYKDVVGSYNAPECLALQDGRFKPQKVGRASDIWSFGCILAEVLSYTMLGPDGVAEFRRKRQVQVTPDTTWCRFHRGPENPNPEVALWLDYLIQTNEAPYQVRMVGLIRNMLSMDPNKRPRSAQVLTLLRGISILSIAGSVNLGSTYQDVGCILGNMRFRSWLVAFNRLLDESDQTRPDSFDFDFPKIAQALKGMRHVFESSNNGGSNAGHRQQSVLRYHHARLTEALPPYYRSIARDHLVNQILQNDVEQLGSLSKAIIEVGDEAGDDDIGVLVAVKHLTSLAEMGRLTEQSNLLLDQKSISIGEDVDIHTLASLGPKSERVLVEWLKYDESWTDEQIGTELRGRLTSVVGLLHAESTTQIPGSLYCKGFFHDESFGAFGVVHGLPPSGTQPITLHGLLRKGKSYCPLLEDRFRLASDICKCIYTFHKVGWLHRNLHSMNVVFFRRDGAGNAEWAKEPRILGFARSRENHRDSFTHGPDRDHQLRHYQHPEYLTHTHDVRYREEFDYYSVGMLLLEIGFWKTLSTITNSDRLKGISDEQFRREVIETRVPHLGVAMGTHYMEATRMCLEGGIAGRTDHPGGGADICYMSFKRLVMDQTRLIE